MEHLQLVLRLAAGRRSHTPCACSDMSTPTQPSSAHPAHSPAMQPATYCQPSASLSRSASNSASQ